MIGPLARLYVVLVVLVAAAGWAYAAEPAKDDFRGLKTGMSRDDATQAASAHGGRCTDMSQSTVGGAQEACAYGNEARAVLYFTPKGHVTRIRVIFAGDFDEVEIQKYIIQSYKLSPDPLSEGFYKNGTPNRFSFSRMGGEKYVLEIFSHDVAMHDDPEPKTRLPRL